MVEKLLFPADIAERYQVTIKTARAYMRRMRHQEKPLSVTESAVIAWDAQRTIDPDARRVKSNKKTASALPVFTGRVPRYKEVFGSAETAAGR